MIAKRFVPAKIQNRDFGFSKNQKSQNILKFVKFVYNILQL